MTLNFKNAKFINAELTAIDLELNHPSFGWIPFTARAGDVEEYGRSLFALAESSAAPFVAPVYTADELRARMPNLTARQFWMTAANINIDKDVLLAAIKAEMEDSIDRKMMIAELESSTFERLNPTVIDLMVLMDIPAEQVDDLWVWASGL
ncbi:hypothetical protein [Rhizobium sp.]|uniref:hypothetical protein n=1 Tax=Rhizobium sp. TaxID=391 RepID=UPI0028B1714E